MKILSFEMTKIWRQKKFIWLALLVVVFTSGIFLQNLSQQSTISKRALEKIEPYIMETDILYKQFSALKREGGLDSQQAKQFEHVIEMGKAFFQWKNAIYDQDWKAIPIYEGDFLDNLKQFVNHGGEFETLQGIELEKAIQKNAWIQLHKLSYVDEVSTLSPALILKGSGAFLLGVLGIAILLLLFGTTITAEQERNTWTTLKTQPISNQTRIVGKYFSLLLVLVIYLAMVVGVGLVIPLIFSDHPLNLAYPQMVMSADNFAVISTFHYMIRLILLFICASAIIFSFILWVSMWMKNSFITLIFTGFIMIIGYFITDMNAPIQTVWNPFQYFRLSKIVAEIPQHTDWMYPGMALIWSCIFAALAAFLPEKQTGMLHSRLNRHPFRGGKTKKYNYDVWNLHIFEWYKIRRKGLLKRISFLLLLLLVFGYIILSQQAGEKEATYLQLLEERADQTTSVISSFEESITNYEKLIQMEVESGNDEGIRIYKLFIDEVEQAIAFYRDKESKIMQAIAAYKRGDWITFHEYQLFENKFANGELDVGNLSSGWPSILGQFTLDASIEEKNWLISRNVRPIFAGEFVPTIYTAWENQTTVEYKSKNEWQRANQKVDNNGLHSLYFYFDNYFYFVPMIIFLFLLGSGFADERGKKQTIYFLKTQPIAEKNLFLGKVTNAITTTLLSFLGLFVCILLISTVLYRFGDWKYPILRYDSTSLVESPHYSGFQPKGFTEGFHFIPLGNYVVEAIVLLCFVLLFLIVLSVFLSLFIRSQLGIFTIVMLTGAVGYFVSRFQLTELTHLSPFTYLNIARITDGEISTRMDNPSINVQVGCITLFVSTIVLLLVGYLFLSRRNTTRKDREEKVLL